MADQPVWRKGFDRVERALGRPLEEAVSSQRYIDALVVGVKVQVAVNRKLRQTVDRQIGAVLHMVNVPTRRDVRRLSQQMATLTGEVRSLAAHADQLAAAAEAPRERDAVADAGAARPDAQHDDDA